MGGKLMITWTCADCWQPIEDHDGYYLIVDEVTATRGEPQVWEPLHTACLPDPEVGYGIDVREVRAVESVERWNTHLSEKPWIDRTDWVQVYRALVRPDPLAEARADRDRARTIAVHLEQEVAHLAAEHTRALRAANVYGSVLEQVGLLQEHYAELGAAIPAVTLQAVLDGGLLEDVADA